VRHEAAPVQQLDRRDNFRLRLRRIDHAHVEARASNGEHQLEPRRRATNQYERSYRHARTASVALGGSKESAVLGVSVDRVGDEPTQRKGSSERDRRVGIGPVALNSAGVGTANLKGATMKYGTCVILMVVLAELFGASSTAGAAQKGASPFWARKCIKPSDPKYASCGPPKSGYYCDGENNCCTSPNMLPSCQPPPDR
jgi:hypothetical protein